MKKLLLIVLLYSASNAGYSQPWQNALRISYSSDGIFFGASSVFQDSSGVPSAIKWKGDTIACVFQWFRAPVNSSTWDRVAVKFSYDNGINWNEAVPIVMTGFPSSYQRPFDPTLTVLQDGTLRLYFSSSDGIPMGNDSIIDTHSAVSSDGINYMFEPDARVNESGNRVIDPAVISFHNLWHYLSPEGAPQQGAYHYISSDGLLFSKVQDIVSDSIHNWTGNYLVTDTNELRFYGAGGGSIWFNSSPNGGLWTGYTSTNIFGGDPTVVKTSSTSYLMIYVGQPNPVGINSLSKDISDVNIFPNPAQDYIRINTLKDNFRIKIYSLTGQLIYETEKQKGISLINFPRGIYMMHILYSDSEKIIRPLILD